ncbi:MAG TPA: cytochrome c oxidase subunit 3 family protein [Phycisphaerae bacterium]|nr:cytochrome c oxidase subunit 3 family protein [Phycisphaerae bacterium]HOJ53948.1 cytochrome c oxidase subunit 3 family protein [Phycisphaerae bacterium]HOL27547.1 cytochrome c oxidase subunit 3 family protein [Phycisphaerae bacterium]HPP22570.1 cytochrome c oxidase subunit 3 family protein [Phycisphaerae bacterium]HPU31746.1 cytochrome c oxidase subunit 3 family protein [Phycisphaerae bacterium]
MSIPSTAEHHTTTHPALAHHFNDLAQQREAGTLGMWTFLVTEVMFFGGAFTGYAYYRWKFPEAFQAASHHLDIVLGTINTVVLICSSLTMVLAVQGAQRGDRKRLVRFLLLTILLALVFLGIKAFEYHHKWVEGHVPGRYFRWDPQHDGAVSPGGAQLFYSFYFTMTGIHAAHMIIGIGVIGVLVWMALRGRFTPESYGAVENTGLYWHFVDIVWIFLFPLLYLIGRH